MSGRSNPPGPGLQTRLVIAFAGLACVAVTIFSLLAGLGFERFVDGIAEELDRLPQDAETGPWAEGWVPFSQVVSAMKAKSGLRAQLNWWTHIAAFTVLSGAVGAGVVLSRHITVPLRRITHTAKLMAGGHVHLRTPRAFAEMGDLADALNLLAERLETADQTRRRLLADMSHELRAPVTSLRCFMEGVHDGMVTMDASILRAMLGEVSRLERMIEGLDASILDGESPLRMDPVDLRRIIDAVLTTMTPRAEAAGLVLECSGCPGESGPWVMGDADRLTQAVLNIVENAVKFTPSGGTVRVSLAKDPDDSKATLSVADTGIGIGAGDLPHVFERFFRSETSRARTTEGAGIGLAVAREVVLAHGGDLTVESQVGEGSVFTLCLPTSRSVSPDSRAPTS